jgi:class 3 adenylate cyclase
MGIFGFCDIRNFTDSTEVLQTKVMVFVNQVAEVVHSQVDKYGGSANKNIGDAFLLIWKFDEADYYEDENGVFKIKKESKHATILADLSLFSFIKIIAKINKFSHLLEYRKDERLKERLGGVYKLRMGFGLHVGWAIEGAIGSGYKIDASYLSPHVNISARLEAATKQYGVPVLFSGELY